MAVVSAFNSQKWREKSHFELLMNEQTKNEMCEWKIKCFFLACINLIAIFIWFVAICWAHTRFISLFFCRSARFVIFFFSFLFFFSMLFSVSFVHSLILFCIIAALSSGYVNLLCTENIDDEMFKNWMVLRHFYFAIIIDQFDLPFNFNFIKSLCVPRPRFEMWFVLLQLVSRVSICRS